MAKKQSSIGKRASDLRRIVRRIQLQDHSGVLHPQPSSRRVPLLDFRVVESELESRYVYDEFFFYQDMEMFIRMRTKDDEVRDYLIRELRQLEHKYLEKHPYNVLVMDGKRRFIQNKLSTQWKTGTDGGQGMAPSKKVLRYLMTKKIQMELGKTYEPGDSIENLSDTSVLHLEKILNM